MYRIDGTTPFHADLLCRDNTRVCLLEEWVNSWRYFWSNCTPLLIRRSNENIVYGTALPTWRLCGGVALFLLIHDYLPVGKRITLTVFERLLFSLPSGIFTTLTNLCGIK